MSKPIHAKPSLYAFYFMSLKEIAKEYGYNLVLHGSLNRDLDLIAIPWVDDPKDELEMIKHFDRELNGVDSDYKEHYLFSILPGGRKSYVINLNREHINESHPWYKPGVQEDQQYYIEISITPTINKP